MFNVDFLPAKFGDCIWMEYGTENDRHHILVDGGTAGTRAAIQEKLRNTPGRLKLDLLVVTHIDRDHIDGVLSLAEREDPGFDVAEIWFNGWEHLPSGDEDFGAVAAERLSVCIAKHGWGWNTSFQGNAVVVPDGGRLPRFDVAGMAVTLLGPTIAGLRALKPVWEREVRKAGLEPGSLLDRNDVAGTERGDEAFGPLPDIDALAALPFEEDTSPANGSSIAMLATFDRKSVLLCGDAYPGDLVRGLGRLGRAGRIPMDLVKLPHHGSAHNVSPELVAKVECPRYVFSTNGSIYHHPDDVAIARVVAGTEQPELVFNYRSKFNAIWENELVGAGTRYAVRYPTEGDGVRVEL